MVTPTVLRLSGDSFQVSDGGGIELSVSTHKVPPGQVRIQVLRGGNYQNERIIIPDESGLRQMLDGIGVPFSDAGVTLFLEQAASLNGKKAVPLSIPPETTATVPPPPPELPKLAYNLRILDDFKAAIRRQGVVGEDATAATTYLISTSRLLDKPVSLAVKGNSSSGKSHIVHAVSKFLPPEAFIAMTGMSEKALVYMREDYKNKTIFLYELEALKERDDDSMTSYFVRTLLSEGRIVYSVTVRDREGDWTTKTITKEGPTNIVFTTTQARVEFQNETRVLSMTTDDSPAQTKRIFLELANEDNGAHDLAEWHELQRWLQTAERRVTIPYARVLAKQVPPKAVRLRRDFGAVLALIRSHAILHQATRDRDAEGRIVASLDDYEVVRDLVADIIAEGVGATVSDTVRETVEAIAALKSAHPQGVTAKALAECLKLDKSAARRRLLVAAGDDYVKNLEEKRYHPGRWAVGDPLPEEETLLPPRHQVATEVMAPDQGIIEDGGTVASDSEGIKKGV